MNPFEAPGGPTAVQSLVLAATAVAATALVTWPLTGWLRARQLGKAIRSDGPDHAAKAGTPTMGGLGLLAVIGAIAGWMLWRAAQAGLPAVTWGIGLPLLAGLGFGALGLVDDLQGLARRAGAREIGVGLTARQMLAAQVLVAGGLVGIAYRAAMVPAPASPLGLGLAAAFAIFAIVGTVNGVNLSDGLDGLAAGLLALAFGWVAWLGTAKASGVAAAEIAGDTTEWTARIWSDSTFAAVVAAACLGFLVHNRHPARVFMGNVTSMALGGALAAACLVTGAWLFLPVFGVVFVAEVVSDIVQIGYFKWTGGRRFFRMAPLHHHFEKGGMPETRVVRWFWLAGLAGGLVAVGTYRWMGLQP